MICTNMDKRLAKVNFVQVLKEQFSGKLTKYGFNHCFAMVEEDKFWSTISFSEDDLLHLFQLHQWLPDRKRIMLGCYVFKNCNRWRTTSRKSCCQCIQQNSLLFIFFHFLTMARERRTNYLRQKQNILWNEMIKFYWTFIFESDINSAMWNIRAAYIFIKLSFLLLSCFLSISVNYFCNSVTFCTSASRDMAFFDNILEALKWSTCTCSVSACKWSVFNISNCFRCKVDGFNLESAVNLDCIFSFSSREYFEVKYRLLYDMNTSSWRKIFE